MSSDPLATVLALRRREVDAARRALAAALAVAAAANERANAADRSIEHEIQRATDPSGDDRLVEAFAAWLPIARHSAAQARALHDRHEADVARLRAELQAGRTALEAIEALIDERAAHRSAILARRAQHDLDEIGARPRSHPG